MKAGIINFYKPTGMTSQTAVNIVKRLTGAKKAGHCGTLDPLACGVLPIMLDNAVKASEYLTDHDKTYIAGIKLGITTDSGDITGNVISEYDGSLPSFEEFSKIAKSFEADRKYDEKEVNEIIHRFHEDHCTIRREMIACGIMARQKETYWLV